MAKASLKTEKRVVPLENLPVHGSHGKMTLKARRDLDRREHEVFVMRRDGYTFQEIVNYLQTKAEEVFEETGSMPKYFKGVASVKDAYDRYIMRCPERFDISGRKEQLELAIQRAENAYKRAIDSSRNDALEDTERSRWLDQAGKWFDRLSKLRALTEDTTIINNFTQNNLILNDNDLIAKLTAKAEDTTILTPEFDAFKSPDTIPPQIEHRDTTVEDAEIVDDGEFDEIEPESQIDMVQPNVEVEHEAIKPKNAISNIQIVL